MDKNHKNHKGVKLLAKKKKKGSPVIIFLLVTAAHLFYFFNHQSISPHTPPTGISKGWCNLISLTSNFWRPSFVLLPHPSSPPAPVFSYRFGFHLWSGPVGPGLFRLITWLRWRPPPDWWWLLVASLAEISEASSLFMEKSGGGWGGERCAGKVWLLFAGAAWSQLVTAGMRWWMLEKWWLPSLYETGITSNMWRLHDERRKVQSLQVSF